MSISYELAEEILAKWNNFMNGHPVEEEQSFDLARDDFILAKPNGWYVYYDRVFPPLGAVFQVNGAICDIYCHPGGELGDIRVKPDIEIEVETFEHETRCYIRIEVDEL